MVQRGNLKQVKGSLSVDRNQNFSITRQKARLMLGTRNLKSFVSENTLAANEDNEWLGGSSQLIYPTGTQGLRLQTN